MKKEEDEVLDQIIETKRYVWFFGSFILSMLVYNTSKQTWDIAWLSSFIFMLNAVFALTLLGYSYIDKFCKKGKGNKSISGGVGGDSQH